MFQFCFFAIAALAGRGLLASQAQQIQVAMSPECFDIGTSKTGGHGI